MTDFAISLYILNLHFLFLYLSIGKVSLFFKNNAKIKLMYKNINFSKLNLKRRHIKEILFLLDLKAPISIGNFAKDIKVNQRTLKEDIKKISDYLSSFSVKLIRKRRVGIYLEGLNDEKRDRIKNALLLLNNRTKKFEREDRFKKILLDCLILEKIPTIEEWCFELGVSRPVISNDVKKVKKFLMERNINLVGKPGVGYRIYGDEEDIREVITSVIIDNQEEETFNELVKAIFFKNLNGYKQSRIFNSIFKNLDIGYIVDVVNRIENLTGMMLVDKDYVSFVVKFLVSLRRIKDKRFVSLNSKIILNIMKCKEFKVFYDSLKEIEERFRIEIPIEEIAYLTINFISSKIRESFSDIQDLEENIYENYSKAIIKTAENVFSLPLSKDKKLIRMLSIHLKSTFEKIKYGITIKNPLLNEVKNYYPLPYSIAERACNVLAQRFNLKIPDSEIGYIAIYIAMAVEKMRNKRRKRKKVAVICATAMGTSSLLFWRLANEMPEIDVIQVGSYKDVTEGRIDPNVDLIISTIPLPQTDIPHIVVSPFLSYKEIGIIREILGIPKTKGDYLLSSILDKVLDERIIFAGLECKNSSEVIRILGNSLIKYGYAKKNLVKEVLEREKIFPTGLNTPIPLALPHAEARLTLRKGFAIATLKTPIRFKEMGNPSKDVFVKIVILPVLTENVEDNAIFYEILKKIREHKIANKIIKATSPKDVKNIIVKSLKT